MERKETISGNMKKSVFGYWPIKTLCDPPEEHCMFATLKTSLAFRGPYMPDGRKQFDIKWLDHLYLVTVCVVPFSVQKGDKETGSHETFSQDGYV